MESKVNDKELLRKILYLLAKYASAIAFQEKLSSARRKKRRNNRCVSLALNSKISSNEVLENNEKNQYTFPKLLPKLNYEVTSTIKSVFSTLITEYSDTNWYLEQDSNQYIHVQAILQFWLDCYLSDMILYKILLNSLKEKEWISFDGFKNSIMSVQYASSHMFLSPKRYNRQIQDNFLTQKFLCKNYLVFFRFVQYSCGSYLNRESVLKVVSIVNKRDMNQMSIWVDYIFTKANMFRKEKKDCINFFEFKSLILKTSNMMD